MEFKHNKEAAELSWQNIDCRLPRTDKLCELVHSGIPHSLRSQIWMRMSGALYKKITSETTYKDIIKASNNDELMVNKQIEKDLLRIMPANVCFNHPHSTGIPRLRRVLRGIAWLYPDIG